MPDPTSCMWRRCFAYGSELTLVSLVLLATLLVAGDVRMAKHGCPKPTPAGQACLHFRSTAYLMRDRAFLWFAIALVVLVIVVFIVPQTILGCSPGKALFGIRVVRPDGSSPGLVRSTVRIVAWGVDGLAVGLPLGLWLALVTTGHRRVGDLLAGTYVVRRTAVGHPLRIRPGPLVRVAKARHPKG